MFDRTRTANHHTVSAKLKTGETDFGTNPFQPSRFPSMKSLFGR